MIEQIFGSLNLFDLRKATVAVEWKMPCTSDPFEVWKVLLGSIAKG